MPFDKIISLTRQLYPTGRAFKMANDSYLESLHRSLGFSEDDAYVAALSTLNSLLPDNNNFTESDATDWERRLGMITNSSIPLEDRKLAIARKMAFPGKVPARQNYLFLEGQLRAAGFDVRVYENRFDDGAYGYITKYPDEIIGTIDQNQHGDFQHGDAQHGGFYSNLVANSIYEDVDADFNVGDNLRSTFFIAGDTVDTFANVDENRKLEFRQLILRLKPVQTVAYLFVNYV